MPLLMCPNDNSPMQEIDRNGVLIDVCPQCRGVWMDRGELEKLLELVGSRSSGERTPHRPEPRHERQRYESPRYDDREGYEKRKKRKKRFELFDFFD